MILRLHPIFDIRFEALQETNDILAKKYSIWFVRGNLSSKCGHQRFRFCLDLIWWNQLNASHRIFGAPQQKFKSAICGHSRKMSGLIGETRERNRRWCEKNPERCGLIGHTYIRRYGWPRYGRGNGYQRHSVANRRNS